MRRHWNHCESLESRRLLSVSVLLSQNWDGTVSNWQIGQNGAQWAIATNTPEVTWGGVTPHSGNSMLFCAGSSYDGTIQQPLVPPNTDALLQTQINTLNVSGAFLGFWYYVPAGSNGQLQVNFGNNQVDSFSMPDNGTNGWVEDQLNITAEESTASPTLQFVYTGSGGTGMYLDDVIIWTDTQDESVAPTVSLQGTLSNITAPQSAPFTINVQYSDNVAVEPASIKPSTLALSNNGNPAGTASLVSSTVQSATSILATYSYLPIDGQWDAADDGVYSVQAPSGEIFDTSGNTIAQTTLGTFDCRIDAPIDISVSPSSSSSTPQSFTAGAGMALPDQTILLDASNGLDDVSYTASFYVAAATTVTASSPGTFIGQVNFQTQANTFSNTPITLDTSGLMLPGNLAVGAYTIGVHITSNDANFPDNNDANNWAVTGILTVPSAAVNPTIVTVMVLYTQQTDSDLGGDAAVKTQINTAIATTNNAFLNSDIDVQLQLVYAGEMEYNETGNPSQDLTNVSTGADGLNGVPALRSQYDADLVSFWTATTYNDTIGIAYIAGSPTDSDIGYNVVVATQMDAYTFAHEVGHNFGAGHAVGDSSGDNSDNGLYDYSHGWRFTDSNGDEYHDIMSYPPGTTIPYYSNPDVDYLGYPTGTSGANNALTISEDAANVAKYGAPAPTATIVASTSTPNITEGGQGEFKIKATIPNTYTKDIILSVNLSYTGSPTQSDYSTPQSTIQLTISAGSTSTEDDVTFGTFDDDVYEGTETITMTIDTSDDYTIGTPSATINVADADTQAITLSSSSISLQEGSNNTVGISLHAAPVGPVTINIAQTSGAGSLGLSIDSMTFTASDFSVLQYLTIAGTSTGSSASDVLTFTLSNGTAAAATLNVFEQNINAPVIDELDPVKTSVTVKSAYQIYASVSSGDGGSTSMVTFYRDSIGTGTFSSSDPVLYTDKSAKGGWGFKGSAKTLPAGANTIFAIATDSSGDTSAPAACTLMVVDKPPAIKKFTAKVANIYSPDASATIIASAKDTDGKVTRLILWVDSNGDGIPDDGEQSFSGTTSLRELLAVDPNQTYTLSAIAYDNNGVASAVKTLTFSG